MWQVRAHGVFLLVALSTACWRPPSATAAPRRVAVAWQTQSFEGGVRLLEVESPWTYVTPALSIDPGSRLRSAHGKLFAVSESTGNIKIIDRASWTVERTIALGPTSQPLDIAPVSPTRAYVTRAQATRLLRVNPETGETSESTDFGGLADMDGVPDLGTMIVDGNRLLVQVRRLNPKLLEYFDRPAQIAIVDLNTEQLIDVDPGSQGIQGIALQGTAPMFKMGITPGTRRLFVSAAYNTHNTEAGIEMIDLDTLQSLDIVAAESDPTSGVCCDMAPFVMVSDSKGYFTFSTDSTLSSHLHFFTLTEGIDAEDLYTSTGYEAANLVFEPATQHLFLPTLEVVTYGLHVFDATDATRLTAGLIPTPGLITDLELVCECGDAACGVASPCTPIPTVSGWGLAILSLITTSAATVRLTCRKDASPN